MPKLGDCYVAAGRYMMDNGGMSSNIVLVHGEVSGQGPLKGVRFGHAWIEIGGNVLEVANGRHMTLPKEVYYVIGNVDKTHKYGYKEFLEKIKQTGHWGPWE